MYIITEKLTNSKKKFYTHKVTFRFTCEYIGTNFCGFQRQINGRAVQSELEAALSKYFKQPIRLVAAGRTDAGVHARGQVCSFSVEKLLERASEFKICSAINAFLPPDVSVRDFVVDPAIEGAKSFNARAHAKAKTYIYRCYVSPHRKPTLDINHHQLYTMPNIDDMRKAAGSLVGTHNFKSFCSEHTDKTNFDRTIFSLEVVENDGGFSFIIRGESFLRNMVRIIVGTLLEVGYGKITLAQFAKILTARDRKTAGPTAPAKGLTLESVEY